MINSFNLSVMPSPRQFLFARRADCYGDVVIWIGRIYCSWNWGRKRSGSETVEK